MITLIKLIGNSVEFSSYRSTGVPYIMVARGGKMKIGRDFAMNNGIQGNPIGYYCPCTFFVDRGCRISIGDHVGISQAALIALADITIEDNVKIGGGVKVFTSDFHSLDPNVRKGKQDLASRHSAPVKIEHDVFIGAGSIILKGVTIGACSVVGAGSVVSKSIPPYQIWAGNPAKFIRDI